MPSPVYILLANQRSGTNMLRKIISTDDRTLCLPEVFNHNYDGRGDFPDGLPYYFEYLEDAVRKDPANCHPDAAAQMVASYFKLIARRMKEEGRTAVVDVKHSSLHHADATWRNPAHRPEMINLFKTQKYPVIHLRRRNLVRLAFSLTRAVRSNQYVAHHSHDVCDFSTDLDTKGFIKRLRELKASDDMVCGWLERIGPKRIELVYEDLFEDRPGSPFLREPFEKIAKFLELGEMRFDLVPRTRKLAPQDLSKEVRNFDELKAVLEGTEFEELLYLP